MKQTEQYLKIGDFASLCGVTKDTLFHYDNIGILKPKTVGGNGYRYYTIQQLFTFEIISILKEAGTPLKEIKWYIEHLDAEHYVSLLSKKLSVLREERAKLDRMIDILHNTITTTEAAIRDISTEPRIETHDEQYLLAISLSRDEDQNARIAKIFEQYKYCLERRISVMLPAGFIIEQGNIEKNVFDSPDYFFCEIGGIKDDPLLHVKPRGTYAVISHEGPYKSIVASHEKLRRFIREQGMAIAGNAYVFEQLGFPAVGDEEKYHVKISVRVE